MEVNPSDSWLTLTFYQNDWCPPVFSFYCWKTGNHFLNVIWKQCFIFVVNYQLKKFLYFFLCISHNSTLLKILCCVSTNSEGQFVSRCFFFFFFLFLSFLLRYKRIFWLTWKFYIHDSYWWFFIIKQVLNDDVVFFFAKEIWSKLFFLKVWFKKCYLRFIWPFVNFLIW